MIVHDKILDPENVASAARANCFAFRQIQYEQGGVQSVIKLRQQLREFIADCDRRYVLLCNDDLGLVTVWNGRLAEAEAFSDALDFEVVSSVDTWNWEIISGCLGYLYAFEKAARHVVEHNENLRRAS